MHPYQFSNSLHWRCIFRTPLIVRFSGSAAIVLCETSDSMKKIVRISYFLRVNLRFYFLFLELQIESFSNPQMGLPLSVWGKLILIPYPVDKFSPLLKLRKYDISISLNLDISDLCNNNFIILCYSSILHIGYFILLVLMRHLNWSEMHNNNNNNKFITISCNRQWKSICMI